MTRFRTAYLTLRANPPSYDSPRAEKEAVEEMLRRIDAEYRPQPQPKERARAR